MLDIKFVHIAEVTFLYDECLSLSLSSSRVHNYIRSCEVVKPGVSVKNLAIIKMLKVRLWFYDWSPPSCYIYSSNLLDILHTCTLECGEEHIPIHPGKNSRGKFTRTTPRAKPTCTLCAVKYNNISCNILQLTRGTPHLKLFRVTFHPVEDAEFT